MKTETIIAQIEESLEKVRPHLQADRGDIEFVRYEEETQVVELRFLGNCAVCPLAIMTLRAGIERVILYDVPMIKRIESVS